MKGNHTLRAFVIGSLLLVAGAQAAETPEQAFKSLFGDQLRSVSATSTVLDDMELAVGIIKAADSADLSDELMAVMYNTAFDLASKSPDGDATAFKAMDRLAAAVPAQEINARQKSLALLLKRLQQAKTPEQRQEKAGPYAEALMETADLMAEAGNINSAVAYSRKALSISTSLKMPNAPEIRAHYSALVRRQSIELRRTSLEKKIKGDPSDSTSRKKLIELNLVDLDDPPAASKHLNSDCDEMLQTYVSLAVKPIEQVEPAALDELARWYVQLADGAATTSKAPMLRRSEGYYVQFLDVHTEEDTKRVKASLGLASVRKQIAELEKASQSTAPKRLVAISSIWPCSTTGLEFVWRDAAWVKGARGTVGAIARAGKLTLRGKARVTSTAAMYPAGGAFLAGSEVNAKLLAACRKSNEFTVEAMIKPDGHAPWQEVRIISFSRVRPESNFAITQKRGTLSFSVSTGDSPDGDESNSLFELSQDKWHHMVVTYRVEKDESSGKTNGKFTSYLNGRRMASGSLNGGLLSEWKPMSLLFGDEYVERSDQRRDPREMPWPRDWRGRLKGVAVYSRAISVKEVAAKYKSMRAVIEQQEQVKKKTEPEKSRPRTPWKRPSRRPGGDRGGDRGGKGGGRR